MTYEEYLKSLGKVEIGDVYYFPILSIGFGTTIGGMCVVIGFDTEHQNMPVLVSERMTIVKEAEYNILTKLKKSVTLMLFTKY